MSQYLTYPHVVNLGGFRYVCFFLFQVHQGRVHSGLNSGSLWSIYRTFLFMRRCCPYTTWVEIKYENDSEF